MEHLCGYWLLVGGVIRTMFITLVVFGSLLFVFSQPSQAQQTPIQQQCSERADALALHGEARKAFRSQCKLETPQGSSISSTTPAGQARKSPKVPKDNNGVSIGMTAEQVRKSSWGKPKSINETITAGGKHEQWAYGGEYLYLENGVLTSIQTHR
jgi:hypothetical protein